MLLTVALLFAAIGLIIVGVLTVRMLVGLRALGAQLALTRAELDPRHAALSAAVDAASSGPETAPARAGHTIGGASGAAQKG
ncbi:hypothetical protein [Nocardiopsis ansamitocini]|uniref:hypothetical protein n=1 Tax=Nocardiopsis ansamitocini TaxID=1670832 RepID=UPI0025551630|nr:hypothetical protein [Nocardiopsis ansamitocini]